jgi:hypothetical protein
MSQRTDDSTLLDRHYITVVLRLTLDQTGHLLQGSLADTTHKPPTFFIGPAGLHQVVDAWLRQQQAGEDTEPTPHQHSS